MRIELGRPDEAKNKLTNYGLYLLEKYERVLELGPYDGTDTVYLAKNTKKLICIEARKENVEAIEKRVKEAGFTNVDIVVADLEIFPLERLGEFDCVWASGIIYHVQNPDQLIKRITEITTKCYGWTHLAAMEFSTRNGYAGESYKEGNDPLSGLSSHSWWLSPREFVRVWEDLGWRCDFTTQPQPHPNGSLAACFMASRS
jgi:SAM-dependent methyltransferase